MRAQRPAVGPDLRDHVQGVAGGGRSQEGRAESPSQDDAFGRWVAPGLADLHITYGPSARRQRLQVTGGGEITISGVPLDVTATSPPVGES